MNKVFLGIVLAVCILGMLLVMLNDRLGRKSEPVASMPATEQAGMDTRGAEIEAAARALEMADASRALAPPIIEEQPEFRPDAPLAPSIQPAPQGREELQPFAETPKAIEEPQLPVTPPARPAQQEQKPQLKPEQANAKPDQPAEPVRPEPKPAQNPAQAREIAQPAKGSQTVNRFVIYSRDKGATVRIGGTSKMNYTSMTLANPDRVVVDLPGNWKFPANPGVPKNDLVSAVRVGQSGDKTRVVIDLKMPARKVLLVPFKSGDGVDVRVDR